MQTAVSADQGHHFLETAHLVMQQRLHGAQPQPRLFGISTTVNDYTTSQASNLTSLLFGIRPIVS